MRAVLGATAGCRPNWAAIVFALLTVPAGLAGSIDLTFSTSASGRPVTGSGTGTGSIDFGTVSRYGVLPTNVTRTTTASDYTVSTNIGVRVNKTSETSANYTFRARLVQSSTFVWKVANTTVSTTFVTINASRNYSTVYNVALRFVVPLTTTTGLNITQDLEYLAIAN